MEVINYLQQLNKFGVKPGLERIKLLLNYLGNPQDELDIIHVAGTNGKGSTTAILTSIYKEAGYKVGSYNSPEVVEFNERIRINDQYITNRQLEELIKEIEPSLTKVAEELEHPTFFEVITALAFLYFANQNVDLVILEVGLGGRLDATNVATSLISVITNVSLDHTEYLGDSLAEITAEKAGIIEPGQSVVTGAQKLEVLDELKQICQGKKAKLINIRDSYDWKVKENKLLYQVFDIVTPIKSYQNLCLSLIGEHQIVNATTALAVIENLEIYPVTNSEIKKGMKEADWPGRLEVIAEEPRIILDGAHNLAAARRLKETIKTLDYDKLILILSILRDKDILGIIKTIVPKANQIIITKNGNNRSEDVSKLEQKIVKYNSNIEIIPKLSQALKFGINQAREQDLILVTGSLYTVAEARKVIVNSNK